MTLLRSAWRGPGSTLNLSATRARAMRSSVARSRRSFTLLNMCHTLSAAGWFILHRAMCIVSSRFL